MTPAFVPGLDLAEAFYREVPTAWFSPAGGDGADDPIVAALAELGRRQDAAAVGDSALRALLPVGALDQLTHGDDTLVTFSAWPRRLVAAYRDELAATAAAAPPGC